MHSLRIKLIGAFAGVILLGVIINSLLINQLTQSQFSQYVTQTGRAWAARMAPSLAGYYAQHGSWQGVDNYFSSSGLVTGGAGAINTQSNRTGSGMMGSGMMGDSEIWNEGMGNWMGPNGMGDMWGMMDIRLILADQKGIVVADTATTAINQQLTVRDLQAGIPLQVNSQPVGTLLALSNTPVNQSSGSDFLNAVRRNTWITGILTALFGLLLGYFLFRQIVSPIQAVTSAASTIAAGNLNQRVPVRSNDEVGTLARTFNRMADTLEQDQKTRQTMIADIAHELRTPVTILQSNLEAMLDGVLATSPEEIASLRDEAELLSRLIADLRLLSLAEAGQLKLEKRPVPVNHLVQRVIDGFRMQVAEQKVTILAEVKDPLPLITIDGDRMSMVLRNLISNALRYTSENGKIVLSATQEDREILLEVTDTGIGIAPADLPFIFDRFYRADKSRSRSSGGSGIGLAIVKQLVEAHGGSVSASSPAFPSKDGSGYGSRFSIRIPVVTL